MRGERPGALVQWEEFWFRPVPSEIYAALRVVVGALCILDLLGATPISMFWDLDGISPLPGGGPWGLRGWLAESGFAPAAARLFFWGSLVVYVWMTVGVWSHAGVVLAFLASIFQAAWNVLPLSAAHVALTVVLFTLVWADCGQALRPRWGAVAQRPTQPIGPLRLLRYQVCLIYFSSGISKLSGPLWRDGSAIYYALNHNTVQRFPIDVPLALQGLTTLATYGTLGFELAFPLLVAWRRTRLLTLMAGVALHLGAWATLEIGPFSLVIIGTYVAFLDPACVASAVRRGSGWAGSSRNALASKYALARRLN